MSTEHKRPMVAFVAVAVVCGVLLANASRSHAMDLLRHTVLPAMVAGPVLHLSDRTATAEPDPATTVDAADEAAARPAETGTSDRATTRQRAGHGRQGGVAAAQAEPRGHGGRDVRGHHGDHAHDGVNGDTSWGFGGDEPTEHGDDHGDDQGDDQGDGHETSTPSTPGTDDGEHSEHGDHRRHHGHHGGHGHGDDHGWPSDDQDPSTPPEDDGSSDDGGWGDDHDDDHGDHGGHHGHHGWSGWSH